MNITLTCGNQTRFTSAATRRIIETATMRLKNRHAALVDELLRCGVEHAAKDELYLRLAILQDLHLHAGCEQRRGRENSWLFDPCRLKSLRSAILTELDMLKAKYPSLTRGQQIFAMGIAAPIAIEASKWTK